MYWLGKVVTVNFLRRALFDAILLLLDAGGDEEIPYVNMTGFIPTRIISVPLHEDCTRVILVHDILVYLETLPP